MTGKKFSEVAHLAVGFEKHGFSLPAIEEWVSAELAAGRRSTYDDFRRIHGICPSCDCYGLTIVGWDMQAVVPYWAICETCGGTGRVSLTPAVDKAE